MKISENSKNLMIKDIQVVVDYLANESRIFDILNPNTQYQIWNITFMNRKYDNNNANVIFVNGSRLLSQISDYEFYIDDTNDNTISTALKSVFKSITNNFYKHN